MDSNDLKIPMDTTIVNPLTLEEKDLVRLAAFIDCEGTITLQRWNKNKGGCNIQPRVSIFNSDPVFVEHVLDIYNRLGVKIFIETQKRQSNHKVVYRLVVLGINRVHKVLTAIKPYLINKRGQADVVLEFCMLRIQASMLGRGKQVKYGPRELELQSHIRLLNLRGVSETENCEVHKFTQSELVA
jgi:LAGLIDADG-like domain